MITNDERREVAARLRDKYRERMEPGQFMPQDLGLQALDYLEDLESCLPEGDSAFTVIADLIDPTCHDFGGQEGTNGEGYDFACSACGWRGAVVQDALPSFCPHCGARVVGGNG